jgi:exonuclease SbcD
VELPGKGLVYALPFVDPEVVRGLVADDAVRGHAAATGRMVERIRADAAARHGPSVLLAHCFVQGAAESPDSERPLVVGTAGCVPAEALAGFDYVALGHLHAPQEVARGVRYSGSLLTYSFGEADHEKSVVLAEVTRGCASVRTVPLGTRRQLARLRGTLAELLGRADLAVHERNLVEVMLDDPGYVLDARARLQARFAHVLNVQRSELALAPGQGTFGQQVAGAGRDDQKLFESFFETVTGALPGPEHRLAFTDALDAIERKDRAA